MKNAGPIYRDFFDPLQKAIFDRLTAASIVDQGDTAVPVVDNRAEKCPFPYVQIGEAKVDGDESTKCHAGMSIRAQIDIWSRKNGTMSEANCIAVQVLLALTSQALVFEESGNPRGFEEVSHMVAEDSQNFREKDGVTVRRMLRIRYFIQDRTTVQN